MTKVTSSSSSSGPNQGASNVFDFSSHVSTSSTSYSYVSSSNRTITVIGTDILDNGAGRFSAGTITEVRISEPGLPGAISLTIEDININGFNLLGSGGFFIPANEDIWRTLLEGSVMVRSDDSTGYRASFDGYRLDNEVFDGSLTQVRGLFQDNAILTGDFEFVEGTSILYGGRFDFVGAAYLTSGDALYVSDDAILLGGDDRIIFRKAEADQLNDTSIWSYGDNESVNDSAVVIGGDDLIDYRKSTASLTRLLGDSYSAGGTSSLFGGDDTLFGSQTDDNRLYGDLVTKGATVRFVGGDDLIYGGKSNDRIYGDIGSSFSGQASGGDDTLIGGAGDDEIYGDWGNIAAGGNGGDDTIFGGTGSDTLAGNAGDDYFRDGFGPGTIYGGNGEDYFDPTQNGAHTFYGGSGIDTIDYSRSSNGITIDLSAGTGSAGWANNDVVSSVEKLIGTSGIDRVTTAFNYNDIRTGNATDRVWVNGGSKEIRTGNANDRIDAGSGANSYYGGDGFDILSYRDSGPGVTVDLEAKTNSGGYAEDDFIRGIEHIFGSNGGNDRLFGDSKGNILRGYDGDDRVSGRGGADSLEGHAGEDWINGGKGGDRLFGGADDDLLDGDRGNDLLYGGGGEDTFHYDRHEDISRIKDFQNDTDTIELDGFNASYNAFARATRVDGDVIFDFGGGDFLIVENTTIGDLRNDLDIV